MDGDDQVLSSTSKAQSRSPLQPTHNAFDSGYHGSQVDDATQPNEPLSQHQTPKVSPAKPTSIESPASVVESEVSDDDDDSDENVVILGRDTEEPEERRTTEGSFQSAKEEQNRNVTAPLEIETEVDGEIGEGEEQANQDLEQPQYPVLESPSQDRILSASPQKRSPQKLSPTRQSPTHRSPARLSPTKDKRLIVQEAEREVPQEEEDVHMDDAASPSEEGSSPIRPIVRKSSLNFASLPAREPLTTKKSIGNRISRTSQLEQPQNNYYGRQTGGKSLGNTRHEDDDGDDEMDVDEPGQDDTDTKMSRLHNKTSTQRLQDQISKLGQSQTGVRPSKSFASSAAQSQANQPVPAATTHDVRQKSPERKSRLPGAFPDDEDSWIGPPPPQTAAEPALFSPRPALTKSHTTDVMEQIHGKESVGGSLFNIPKRGEQSRNASPIREPVISLGHVRSTSTLIVRSPKKAGDSPGQNKPISVSNPTPSVHTINEEGDVSPPKSPSRSFKGSPLKAAKDKFSSILKTSRGLFASSAAVSADAKSSALSLSTPMGMNDNSSVEDVPSQSQIRGPAYPNLDSYNTSSQQSSRQPASPPKASARKTRASTEREEKRREEAAREARELEAAQRMDEQLEKARLKVREDARVFHQEQERVANMQREVMARKDQAKQAKASQAELPRATRTSPRKTKAQLEAEGVAAAAATTEELVDNDVEMVEAPVSHSMPPPARPKSQIGRPAAKRPVKAATGQQAVKGKPTVIRVDTGSQRGHHNYPSNATLSASLQDSLNSSTSQPPTSSQGLKHKASTSSIQSKTSTNSFKSAASKALESAARKKEQASDSHSKTFRILTVTG